MKTAIIIPARYASSRLPGKPLLRETGKYLIQHVYERACESAADMVIVATDDERILRAVESFGGHAAMTRADHRSGTDRVAVLRLVSPFRVNVVEESLTGAPGQIAGLGECDDGLAQ